MLDEQQNGRLLLARERRSSRLLLSGVSESTAAVEAVMVHGKARLAQREPAEFDLSKGEKQ